MGIVFEKPTKAKHPSLQKARTIPGNKKRMCWAMICPLPLGHQCTRGGSLPRMSRPGCGAGSQEPCVDRRWSVPTSYMH